MSGTPFPLSWRRALMAYPASMFTRPGKGATVGVAHALSTYGDVNGCGASMSVDRLAGDTGLNAGTVRLALRWMTDGGWLRALPRQGPRSATVYDLTTPGERDWATVPMWDDRAEDAIDQRAEDAVDIQSIAREPRAERALAADNTCESDTDDRFATRQQSPGARATDRFGNPLMSEAELAEHYRPKPPHEGHRRGVEAIRGIRDERGWLPGPTPKLPSQPGQPAAWDAPDFDPFASPPALRAVPDLPGERLIEVHVQDPFRFLMGLEDPAPVGSNTDNGSTDKEVDALQQNARAIPRPAGPNERQCPPTGAGTT